MLLCVGGGGTGGGARIGFPLSISSPSLSSLMFMTALADLMSKCEARPGRCLKCAEGGREEGGEPVTAVAVADGEDATREEGSSGDTGVTEERGGGGGGAARVLFVAKYCGGLLRGRGGLPVVRAGDERDFVGCVADHVVGTLLLLLLLLLLSLALLWPLAPSSPSSSCLIISMYSASNSSTCTMRT